MFPTNGVGPGVCDCQVSGGGSGTDGEGNQVQIGLTVCTACTPIGSVVNYAVLNPPANRFRFLSVNNLTSVTCNGAEAVILATGRLVQGNQIRYATITITDNGPANDDVRVQLYTDSARTNLVYDSGTFTLDGNVTLFECP